MKLAFAACVLAVACGGDDDSGPLPAFPADYDFAEVRDCRSSADHDLNQIRIVADPVAAPIYAARDRAFPVDAIVLKEEFDFADVTCSGPIKQWTVMVKADTAENGGWFWQRVDADRNVVSENEPRCVGCHADCGRPPDGYEGTCAVP